MPSKPPPRKKAAPPPRKPPASRKPKSATKKKAATKKRATSKRSTPPKKSARKTDKKTTRKKTSARPATENKVPKVRKIQTKQFSDEAVRLGVLLRGMDAITVARYDRIEIRNVPDRIQVMLNEELGLDCRRCYSQPDETDKILKFFKKVPSEFWPAKWERTFAA